MNLGKTVLELRKKNNVTQEELAAELGVTAAAVSKWENGYTLPDILMLCALADFFEVTTDELLGRKKERAQAVIAAQSEALGQQIARIAQEYGIAAKSIFTNYEEATATAQEDGNIRYIIAGFYDGWYDAPASTCALVSVHPTDAEILDAFRIIFDQYLDPSDRQFIVN